MKQLLLLTVLFALVGVAGCGQSGPLYLPSKVHQDQQSKSNNNSVNNAVVPVQ